MKRKVVLASRNRDKIRELKELCEGLPFTVLSAEDFPGLADVIEDGTTMLGNASRKAIITAAYTGEISIADDTSLQVRALNGFPDVFAARFSGPGATYDSNARLVQELLEDVPDDMRQARFGTACVWVDPRPLEEDPRRKYSVPQPAARRWLRNPWYRSITVREPELEAAFWNRLVDREEVWAEYRRRMTTDLVSLGQNREQLAEIAAGLLAETEYEEGLRMPDTRIWTVTGPDEPAPPPTNVSPSGLDPEAPGRSVNQEFWLEISAEGRLLGTINRQPVGAGGFGYDPVFVPIGETRTLAEYESAVKNAISHRGRAFRRLMRAAREAYGV
jgi:inosine/xanthosine triphosphate pyrophosphatase family protein